MRCSGLKQLTVVLAATLVGFMPVGVSAATLAQQSSSERGVTLRATPRDLAPAAKVWEFDIVLESHSQDLSDDVKAAASLVVDGSAKRAPTVWEGDPPGGHHRKGVLRFSPVTPRPQGIELVILRPGETIPRIFRWQLQ